jgi:hypothetical protein
MKKKIWSMITALTVTLALFLNVSLSAVGDQVSNNISLSDIGKTALAFPEGPDDGGLRPGLVMIFNGNCIVCEYSNQCDGCDIYAQCCLFEEPYC